MIGVLFACAVLYVNDGDGIRCRDGTRIRLAGIDAPEISSCRRGRVRVPGDAQASKRKLASLATGTLSCRQVGTSYNRVVAWCDKNGVDLSCAMVRAKQAVPRYANREKVCR